MDLRFRSSKVPPEDSLPNLGLKHHYQGDTVLHGSSVTIGNSGIVILGPAGKGKSSLAAVLRLRGHLHISDGMCVIQETDGYPYLKPGPLSAKLWPDTLQALGQDPERFERVLPDHQKRVVPITTPAVTHPVAVSHVFSLEVDSMAYATELQTLSPVGAVWELIRNYYLAEFIGMSEAPRIFDRCTNLARTVKVRKLLRPDNLMEIDSVAVAIEEAVGVRSP